MQFKTSGGNTCQGTGGFISGTIESLVLVMEHSQREKILEKYGHADPENVYVLTELVGDELEIIDPYGGTLQAYGLCYETMRKTILKLVNLLNESEDNGTD